MPITVKCDACGNKAQVPDSAAGAKGKCRACGAVTVVPRAGAPAPSSAAAPAAVGQAARKVCTTCGVDVAGKKRTKDPKGNYYCQPCWDAKVQGAAVPVQAAAAGVGAAGVGASAGSEESVDFPCSVCGVLGGPDDVYDDNGRYVCKECWDAQESGGPAAQPDPVWSHDQPPGMLPLPPMPNAAGGSSAAAAPGGPPPVPEVLFCEGCSGSFPVAQLTTAPDGAVLCQSCIAYRNNPLSRPAYAAPAAGGYAPPTYGAPRPQKSSGGGNTGGILAAGGTGLLVVLLIAAKIGIRGCNTYERNERRREREQYGANINVPAHVQQAPAPGAGGFNP